MKNLTFNNQKLINVVKFTSLKTKKLTNFNQKTGKF